MNAACRRVSCLPCVLLRRVRLAAFRIELACDCDGVCCCLCLQLRTGNVFEHSKWYGILKWHTKGKLCSLFLSHSPCWLVLRVLPRPFRLTLRFELGRRYDILGSLPPDRPRAEHRCKPPSTPFRFAPHAEIALASIPPAEFDRNVSSHLPMHRPACNVR